MDIIMKVSYASWAALKSNVFDILFLLQNVYLFTYFKVTGPTTTIATSTTKATSTLVK